MMKGKVVLVGDTSVGKTAIVNCFNKLSVDVAPTVGANSITCTVSLETGEDVVLNVWDTAGQDDFKCLVPMYARCSQVAIIVYDQSKPVSFESVPQWTEYMKTDVGVPNVFLVANKSDLEEAVPFADGVNYAQKNGLQFFRTSAITGDQVDFLFKAIAEVVAAPEEENHVEVEPVFSQPVNIESKNNHEKKGCC